MTLPKSMRREFTWNDELFYWMVISAVITYDDEPTWNTTSIFVEPANQDGALVVLDVDSRCYFPQSREREGRERLPVTPWLIRALLEEATALGWRLDDNLELRGFIDLERGNENLGKQMKPRVWESLQRSSTVVGPLRFFQQPTVELFDASRPYPPECGYDSIPVFYLPYVARWCEETTPAKLETAFRDLDLLQRADAVNFEWLIVQLEPHVSNLDELRGWSKPWFDAVASHYLQQGSQPI